MQRKRLLSFCTIFTLLFGQFASLLHAVGHLTGEHSDFQTEISPLTAQIVGARGFAHSSGLAHEAGHSHAAESHQNMASKGHFHTGTLHSGAKHGASPRFADVLPASVKDAHSPLIVAAHFTVHEDAADSTNCLAFHVHGAGQAVLPDFPLVSCCFNTDKLRSKCNDAFASSELLRSVYIRGPPLQSISFPV